jgi:hypothetical protein
LGIIGSILVERRPYPKEKVFIRNFYNVFGNSSFLLPVNQEFDMIRVPIQLVGMERIKKTIIKFRAFNI